MEETEEKNESSSLGVVGDSSFNIDAIVQNMAIAHEMAVDVDFKMKEVPSDSIQGQVKQIVHQAFWDVLQQDISKDPPNYEHAILLLAELKEVLLSLIFEHNNSLRERINDVLDIELIKQQSEHGIVDIHGYASFIIQTMSQICVPARDDDIKNITAVDKDLVPLFREIFHVLDLMKLDMANFRLSILRPQIIQNLVDYEREKFKEYLTTNPNGLQSTKEWMKKGLEIAKNESNKSPELLIVCRHCYVGIMLGEQGFPYPETLLMDSARMAEMRLSVKRLIKITSVLVVTLNINRLLTSDAEYKKILKESTTILLQDLPESDFPKAFPNIYDQVKKETDLFLLKRELKNLDNNGSELLKNQILNLADDESHICKLINKRIYSFLMGNLLQANASNPSTLQVPAALEEIQPELLKLTKRLGHIVWHNYNVFQPFYTEILQNILT